MHASLLILELWRQFMVYYVDEWINKYASVRVLDERLLSRNRATRSTLVGYVKEVKQFIGFLGFNNPDEALEYLKNQTNRESVIACMLCGRFLFQLL